uniref:1-acylglycerol-3-phosphate O-acyltransferase ABHD5 n=1 Tax=Phallusia mammillata TaxID=59560 RepID=A0A6F9D635_9ASCI|nr:abhydrolase domain-containing protein 4 [Phallusia mammillata]
MEANHQAPETSSTDVESVLYNNEMDGTTVGWLGSWCRWKPTSENHLIKAETKMLEFVKCQLHKMFVSLPSGNKIWTLVANRGVKNKTPLVMVHGFAGGVGLWALNYEALSKKRSLYAFDLLGFGRSSRPTFDTDPQVAEETFVQSIEEWREAVNIDKMILLGHSFGGYLVSCYAMKYPERVKSLILADPWGFPKPDPDSERARRIPLWVRAIVRVLSPFNPLSVVRAAGPWGPNLIKRFRADFKQRYPEVTAKDENTVFEYIYHCNAGNPSGEAAFKEMNENLGYAYRPMLTRISAMNKEVPVTFVYGARSWMDISSGHQTQNLLPDNHVEVYSVKGAGHHVYADRPDLFREIVTAVCDATDTDD